MADGSPEIVVTAGTVFPAPANGVGVALNARGQLLPGWPQLPRDFGGGGAYLHLADGWTDGVLGSPSSGDITGDRVPETIYGAND